MTKIILTHEVPNLGTPGDVVDVKPGYARNYLLPRALATPWTKGAQKQIDQMKAAQARRQIASLEQAHEVRDMLVGQQIDVEAKAGPNGRLFGSVSTSVIAAAIKEQLKATVDHRKILVKTAIRTVGTFGVQVRLYEDVEVDLLVRVTAAK
ncbi:MAG: 50S ribosomal protein L9 [Actinomycetaceae bacterium]|nr:50S ribosomal protein L9 [Actinomycetaceae bacterium]